MALRGTELILFVRAQNQASYTLRRVAADVRALTHARDLQQRAERLAIQQAKVAAREVRNNARIESMMAGGGRRVGFQLRQARLDEQRRSMARALEDIDTKRLNTNTQILRNRERELRLAARQAKLPATGPRAERVGLARAANQRQLEGLTRRMGTYSDAVNTVNRRLRNLDTSQRKLNADFRNAVGTLRNVRTEQALLARQSAQLALAQREVSNAMRLQAAEQQALAARTISHMGRIAQFAGLIGTAALGAASSVAASFNTMATQAATQARDINAPLSQVATRTDEIQAHILKAMQRFPANAEEMSQSAYDIFSSVNLVKNGIVDMAEGFRLMDTANRIAVAGNEDLATATNTLVTVVNNFDPRLQNLNKTLNTMFAIIRFGRMHLGEFDDMMNRIAPAARTAGQNLKDVGGAMALLTTQIPSQSQVSTGLARMLEIFANPDFIKGMETLRAPITVGEGAQKQLAPLPQIFERIVKRFPELQKGGVQLQNFFRTVTRLGRFARTGRAGEGVLGTIYARKAFGNIITDMGTYRTTQKNIVDDTNEFNSAYMAMINTQGVQWKIFMNQVKVAVILIGQAAIPIFIKFGRYLERLITWFRELDPQTRNFYVRIAAVVSIVTLLSGVFLSIGGAVLGFMATLRIFALTSAAAAAEVGPLALWMGRLASVAKLLGAVGVIAIALKVLWTGDMSGKDFLMAAIAGGAFGFGVGGPLGAAIGAITVPVVLELTTKLRGGKQMAGPREAFSDLMQEAARGHVPEQFKGGLPEFADFQRQFIQKGAALGLPAQLLGEQLKSEWSKQASAALQAGAITQAQYLKGMALVGFSDAAVEAQRKTFQKNYINLAANIKPISFLDNLQKAMNDVAKGTKDASQLDKLNKILDKLGLNSQHAAEDQQQLAQAMKNAREQAEKDIDQAANKLTQTYMDLKQANQQAFGQLFQGPFFREFGQYFEQWDISPKIQDLTKDLKGQLREFNSFNSGLATIAKRGAPAELVNQLKALGPDALEKIEVLRKASPKQFNEFVRTWKSGQDAINKATKIDFDKQLHQWFRYGKGIAQQIIFGLRSENVALDNAFRQYITNKFPGYVSEAVAKARKETQAQQKASKPKMTAGQVASATKPTVVNHKEENHITVHAQPGEATMDTARRTAHLWKNGARTSKKGTGR